LSLDAATRHWLVARPVAHRGLHAKSHGIVENSLAAATAAIDKAYAIECDVQLTQDGEAVVFHDETLERLTQAVGSLGDLSTAEITQTPYRDGVGTIPLFGDLLTLVAGRVPLIVEIKSRFDGDLRLAEHVATLIENYSGPLALQSFDPALLVHLRKSATRRPIGLIAQANYTAAEWPGLPAETRQTLATFSDYAQMLPDFLAWNIADLPHAVTTLWRAGLGLPLLTWTVKEPTQADLAARFADQIIFEGFCP
jgi:glycerophosphoryl diester phosphodiesterase